VGDIGGTNARFATCAAPGAPLGAVATYPVKDFGSLEEAVRRYVTEQGGAKPVQAAIGIANPVTGDQVKMTNHNWSFSIDAMRRALGLDRLLVLNDFQALALSLPGLAPDTLEQVGGTAPVAGRPLALIGPGTGLGVAGLVWCPDGRPQALDGEGGHVTLPAETDEELQVAALLRTRFGHASAERAVSGQGLENLHEALDALHGWKQPRATAAEITRRALDGSDPACAHVVQMFCALLGCVAGNLALTLGARGGVYLGGGIVPRLGPLFAASPFRERFEAKGRMAEYLRPIPVYVIKAEVSPALVGALRALEA
jgi:glucokinase